MEVGYAPTISEWDFYYELGHEFDWAYLSPADRAAFLAAWSISQAGADMPDASPAVDATTVSSPAAVRRPPGSRRGRDGKTSRRHSPRSRFGFAPSFGTHGVGRDHRRRY
ncbi:MAG TPA: hypothetical protein VEF89_34165 [Solirubrobacteraceae bacterium]|nr:hypothetical protein [Solirubrobacteraceae bacterium]